MNLIINSDMSEYWNGDGGQKWVGFHRSLDVGLKPFGDKAMDAAALLPNDRVIDIGCGCGDTTFELAHQVGPAGNVLGVDISNVILQQAQDRRARLALQDNISFECVDAQSNPFRTKAFNLVFSRFGVMFFDDPNMAFTNIRRSLMFSGRLVFVCWQPVKSNQWVSLPLEICANHLKLPPPTDPNEPGPFSLGESDRVQSVLNKAGFNNIVITAFEKKFNVGKNIDEAASFLTQMGPASGVISDPEVDNITRERIYNELRDELEAYQTPHGVELNAATWIVTARNS